MNRIVHTFTGPCTGLLTERPTCSLGHFNLIPVVKLRGTFKMRDIVSDASLRNLYIAGKAIK